jgi:hypothetical protein
MTMTSRGAPANLPVMMSTLPRKPITSRPRVWLLVALGALLTACSTGPEERLAQARAAAADKNLDEFVKYFTRDSANLLRDMVRAGDRSKIRYLRDPFSVLPEGDVEDVKTEANYTVLKVKGRRGNAEIRMFMENDEWSIDLFSLDALWEPLRGGKR